MAMEPTANEACVSVLGSQVTPPSIVFQTPPAAPPRYAVLPVKSVGSMAMAFTRPEVTGLPPLPPNGSLLGCGPIRCQVPSPGRGMMPNCRAPGPTGGAARKLGCKLSIG